MMRRFSDRPPSELTGCAIHRGQFEPIDQALKRLKKATSAAGIPADLRRHSRFVPRTERRRLKSIIARKRP
jgi:ribosomal protein S21